MSEEIEEFVKAGLLESRPDGKYSVTDLGDRFANFIMRQVDGAADGETVSPWWSITRGKK